MMSRNVLECKISDHKVWTRKQLHNSPAGTGVGVAMIPYQIQVYSSSDSPFVFANHVMNSFQIN